MAEVLHKLGKTEEALSLIQETVDRMTASNEFGPTHPETIASRDILANIASDLGDFGAH
jgi:hypothetical protein